MEESKRSLVKFKSDLEPLMKVLDDQLQQLQVGDAVLGRARPFVCDGNPFDCDVFIVGFNPATPLPGNFWSVWNKEVGFNKYKWLKRYERARRRAKQAKAQANGTLFQYKPSPTRTTLKRIADGAGSIKLLETNIYATPTSKQEDLQKDRLVGLRRCNIFKYLVEKIDPKLVIAHGKLASEKCTDLKRTYPGMRNTEVWHVPHLSMGWYETAANNLGKRIALHLNSSIAKP